MEQRFFFIEDIHRPYYHDLNSTSYYVLQVTFARKGKWSFIYLWIFMKMFEIFRKYLEGKIVITEDDYAFIESVSVIKRLKKHQFLLSADDKWSLNAFVCEGLLRKFSIDDKGNEHSVYFAMENWWTGDRESLMNNTPSRYYIDAIEDSVVLLIHESNFQKIFERLPQFKDLVNSILQRSLNAAHERINSTFISTAEEKYLNLLNTSPSLANRVPLHMLASYLGITPETLSRIRKQIASKKSKS